MKRTMVWTVSSLVALAVAMVLTGCSSGGGGNNTPPDVTMNVTTVTGIPTISGEVDGAGVGGGTSFNGPTDGTIVGSTLYVSDSANNTIRAVDLMNNSVTTFAGTPGMAGGSNGPVASATFNAPNGLLSRGTTTLYVADTGNQVVRMINLNTMIVSTLTVTPVLGGAAALALNPTGDSLFVADNLNNSVHEILLATGATVTSVSGPYAGSPGVMFSTVQSLVTDTNRNKLYAADMGNQVIAEIDLSTHAVTVLAGALGVSGYIDATSTSARFFNPYGLFLKGDQLYVSEAGNALIRMIDLNTFAVTTVAGNQSTDRIIDGVGASAVFNCPDGLAGDDTYLYIIDNGSHVIRKMEFSSARVTTIAGTATVAGGKDGVGPRALLQRPDGIVSDGTGTYLFFTDRDLHTVRRVAAATGDVATIAGLTNDPGADDGTTAGARFNGPAGIAYDSAAGVLYIADSGNDSIRAVDLAREQVNTLALSGAAPSLNGPTGLALAGGKLYFSDTNNNLIKSVPSGTAGGAVSVVASSLTFSSPSGIATDGTRIYVADTGNNRIVSIVSGTATVLAGGGAAGFADGTGAAALFDSPIGLVMDATNTYLYAVDSGNGAVRRITVATGAVQTVAGGTLCAGAADGKGSAAQLCAPLGIAVQGGKVYVTDSGNSIIRVLQ